MVGFVSLSLAGIVAGYSGSRVLAWQMFPESSRWQADIVRVTRDGDRHGLDAPWPGGYTWAGLVSESGLAAPATESNAAYGIEETLEALQHALDWVAANTPNDQETAYLEAMVRYRYNADPPRSVVLRSDVRGAP